MVARLQVFEIRRDGRLVLANRGEVGEKRREIECRLAGRVIAASLLTADEAEEVRLRLEEVRVGEFDCDRRRWSVTSMRKQVKL